MSDNIMSIELNKVKKVNTIKGYNVPDKYVADKEGNVYIHIKDGSRKVVNGKVMINVKKMKPYKTRLGYVEYVLTNKYGKQKHYQAHRIVAELYLPNKNKLPQVNHKDGNRSNNTYNNLEWSSISDNIKHSYSKLRKR